ncbi:MAG: acetylornithine transaminase [Verrucomicrobiota bacterium]|jgi:acetylornithine aminotransferase/acetylornithine/N-succinyldiaminopimelate aminotransferase
MKEIVPSPPPLVHNQFESVRELFSKNVVPSYGRFELAFSHGAGSCLFDVAGKRYLDLGAGIAVCCLGHAHPAITEALMAQSRKLIHVSNLYFTEPQGRLAAELVKRLGPGKCFFANSGAEANEGLFKLARKFGHDEGRFEILTATNSFHGRTLAGIAATGQDKVKKGFEPMTPGFRHIPFNDLAAARNALSPATAAILIEGVQGEGGITPATPEYLLGLRALCDEQKILLFMDGVQCGHYRTGRFQSFQRILEAATPNSELRTSNSELGFLPDGLSMAKSLGGGFPIGAFWVRAPFADLLGPGTHATTFGGTPLACAVALKILEVIESERLDENARKLGEWFKRELERLATNYPQVVRRARGLGFMLGLELVEKERIPKFAASDKTAAIQFVNRLHQLGVLTIPAGTQIVRLLPPLNLKPQEAGEGIARIEEVVKSIA